jgi:hypothetical protein
MEQHRLGLHIPDILNQCVIKIEDVSDYSDLMTIDCELLQITPPGFTFAVHFRDITEGFTKIINAEDLELGIAGDTLPDGVYVIRYSVSPNDKVYVEYNYLRTSVFLDKYHAILCNLELASCEPEREMKEKFKELRDIKMMLDAAKAKVEVCHYITEGMDLYNYALKLLNKFECKNC